MADLITLEEYLVSQGQLLVETGAAEQDQLSQAIAFASDAIRDYADRSFAVPSVTATRPYEYDGSCFLDIDDATAITAVAFSYGTGFTDDNLTAEQFRARPISGPVFTYLVLPSASGGYSPAMGFRQNLDVLWNEGRFQSLPMVVKVTGSFGWPSVPGPVKQAAVLTVQNFVSEDPEFQSESIDTLSHTRNIADTDAIPKRAKELLAPYIREPL